MRLDDLDSAILSALVQDARRSLRDVARLVGSTPTTVATRLERLEASGLVQGATLRLNPAMVPGQVRLVEGQIGDGDAERYLLAAGGLPSVLQALVTQDGRALAVLLVHDLDDEAAALAALAAAGMHGAAAAPARRAVGAPPVHLFRQATIVEERCAQCGKAVRDDGHEERVDGRRIVFCCPSCRRLYLERYARLKQGA